MDTILKLNGKYYCAFCGEEITPSIEGQYLCLCKDAREYRKALTTKLQLEIEASKVMASAPKPKYGLCTVVAPLEDFGTSPNEDWDEVPSNPM